MLMMVNLVCFLQQTFVHATLNPYILTSHITVKNFREVNELKGEIKSWALKDEQGFNRQKKRALQTRENSMNKGKMEKKEKEKKKGKMEMSKNFLYNHPS